MLKAFPLARLLSPLVALLALGAALRTPTFARPMLSDDEAIYAVTADALGRGALLYRDVVDHKPPLVYHVYQAGFALLGPYDTRGAHAAVVLAVLVTALLLFAIKRPDDPTGSRTGLAAVGLFLVFSTTWHDYDALAANGELFLLAPQAGAAWLLLRDLRRTDGAAGGVRGAAVHFAVGALIGVAALFKVQALTFLGASLGLLAWWARLGRAPWAWAGMRAICHVMGAASPAAFYLAACVAAGNADAAITWFVFNFSYLHAGLTGFAALARGLRRTLLVGGVAIVPYALGISAACAATARLLRVLRARRRRAPIADADLPPPSLVLGVLWLITSAVALASGGRFFGHYFHLVLAPLCLLAAPAFARLWAKNSRSVRASLLVLCGLPAIAFFALATVARPLAASWDEPEPPYADVAARVDALTAPDDRLFVWGNSPQLYVLARRPMGARFSFCNYMTGESPGTPTETGARSADANQWPVAWDMLFEDLERRRPALFVDAAAAGWDGYGKYPVSRYPRLRGYLDQHYRLLERRAGVVLYRRRP